ncbi:MAG: gluconate 2-dehydrogenase subunit 3 family protein [Pseudolabrys sp.]
MAPSHLNRRQILSAGVIVGSTVALDRAQARSISGEVPWQEGEANKPDVALPTTRQFFSPEEAEFIEASTARMIPADDLGPGAKEAGVTTFIDLQLAGPFGKGAQWYMQGPWAKGEATQGYQSRMSPAELYRAAIKAIDTYCTGKYSGKKFAGLSGAQQDEVLTGLEKGDIKLEGADSKMFFTMFLQNAMEGFFSDPIYGGNRDMVGWKLVGFPGARYDYRPYVNKHNQKLDLPPVGIKGRPGWNPA